MLLREKLNFFKLHDDVQSPLFSTKKSACFDIFSYIKENEHIIYWNQYNERRGITISEKNQISIEPFSRYLIPTGLIFDIPTGFSVRLHSRSGLSIKKGLVLGNHEGVIDSDYVEEVKLIIINMSKNTYFINNKERIAQGEMVQDHPYELSEILNKPSIKSDRYSGFGSTGIK